MKNTGSIRIYSPHSSRFTFLLNCLMLLEIFGFLANGFLQPRKKGPLSNRGPTKAKVEMVIVSGSIAMSI